MRAMVRRSLGGEAAGAVRGADASGRRLEIGDKRIGDALELGVVESGCGCDVVLAKPA